ncbi:hypothetical protein [Paraflavitalea sp. CAU 1676]|uniref:hypothetical protein n=1 Tax=Paraflavitalea sp. CAU 1676 TaxID=3032598 RepID=UPI0023DBFE65|nr:hypothetical protein [Paraflavitalea sp. CAU 1676]MDF2191223.1 hypothetical protein [Paraflavitalea sp. CAU 1676]
MKKYVFLFRFEEDSISVYRRIDVEGLSPASAHAAFLERVEALSALEGGTFSLMAEQEMFENLIMVSELIGIIDHNTMSHHTHSITKTSKTRPAN